MVNDSINTHTRGERLHSVLTALYGAATQKLPEKYNREAKNAAVSIAIVKLTN